MGPEPVIDITRRRLEEGQSPLTISPGYLTYVLMDTVIDEYFPVLDALGEAIEQLEDDVMARPQRRLLAELFDIKHMLLEMWRVLWPQRDVLNQVSHHSLPAADQETLQHYLRDVTDHLLWIADMVSTFRDTLSSIMDLYMSAVSNRLNQVVNRLTVFALVVGVLTVVGGFYGMNFTQTWPPFNAPWGVPLVVVLMVILSGALLLFFRKKGWF
jgi:magnesium transporter